jgi:hypothetical protein
LRPICTLRRLSLKSLLPRPRGLLRTLLDTAWCSASLLLDAAPSLCDEQAWISLFSTSFNLLQSPSISLHLPPSPSISFHLPLPLVHYIKMTSLPLGPACTRSGRSRSTTPTRTSGESAFALCFGMRACSCSYVRVSI